MIVLTIYQDIAPTYYDLNNFKGEMQTALRRTIEKINRKQSTKGGSYAAAKPARY